MKDTNLPEAVATIAIVSVFDETLRAVYGLYPDDDNKSRLRFRLLKDKTTMPLVQEGDFIGVVDRRARLLNSEFINHEVHSMGSDWRLYDDPNGVRLFNDMVIGKPGSLIVKTTIVTDQEQMDGLARLLVSTYGKEGVRPPEAE